MGPPSGKTGAPVLAPHGVEPAATRLPLAALVPAGAPGVADRTVEPLLGAGGDGGGERSAVEAERPGEAPAPRHDPEAAVFVDASGGRSRWLLAGGRMFAAACAAYLAATTLSVLGAPWVPHLSLPALGNVVPVAHPGHRPALPASALSTPLLSPATPSSALQASEPASSPAARAPGTLATRRDPAPGAKSAPWSGATTTALAPVTQAPPTSAPHASHGTGPPTSAPSTTQGPSATGPTGTSPPTSAPGHSGTAPGTVKHGG